MMRATRLVIIVVAAFALGLAVLFWPGGTAERIASQAINTVGERINRPPTVAETLAQNRHSVYEAQRSTGTGLIFGSILALLAILALLHFGGRFLREGRLAFKSLRRPRSRPVALPPPVWQIEETIEPERPVPQITGGASWIET